MWCIVVSVMTVMWCECDVMRCGVMWCDVCTVFTVCIECTVCLYVCTVCTVCTVCRMYCMYVCTVCMHCIVYIHQQLYTSTNQNVLIILVYHVTPNQNSRKTLKVGRQSHIFQYFRSIHQKKAQPISIPSASSNPQRVDLLYSWLNSSVDQLVVRIFHVHPLISNCWTLKPYWNDEVWRLLGG